MSNNKTSNEVQIEVKPATTSVAPIVKYCRALARRQWRESFPDSATYKLRHRIPELSFQVFNGRHPAPVES